MQKIKVQGHSIQKIAKRKGQTDGADCITFLANMVATRINIEYIDVTTTLSLSQSHRPVHLAPFDITECWWYGEGLF